MNQSSWQTMLLTMILGCGIGCASNEEGAADAKQSVATPQEDRGDTVDVINQDHYPSLSPIAIATPTLRVDPFHSWSVKLAEFVIDNGNPVAHQLGTLMMDFGDLCPMLETVSLADERGIMSDGACYRNTEFTIDEAIPAYGRKRLSVWASTNLGLEATLTAIRMQDREPQPGIRPLVLTLSEGMLRFDALASGPPIDIRAVSRTDEQTCYEAEDAMSDRRSLRLQFEQTETHEVRSVRNALFEVPLIMQWQSLSDERFTRIVHIAPEGSDVRVTSGTLIARSTNRYVSTVDIRPDELSFAISSDTLESETRYSLLLSAAASRGYVRFVIMDEQLTADPDLSAVGCYPSFSDAFVVLPADEWEVSR